MAKVLKATPAQKKALEGEYLNNAVLQFVEDAKGNWVVNTNVINDTNFAEIKEQLESLPLINYDPKQVEL